MNSLKHEPSVDEAPILHVDLDAFFASVEILDDPSLRGRPVAVGGAGARGVIASASYEARRYGVRSGMASVVARRRCPSLVILPGRFDRYEFYSRQFHQLVAERLPVYEPLGLDELFADLRSLRRLNVRPLTLAREVHDAIRAELLINCGVGLGPNKLFAKLASKESKPRVVDGVLRPGDGVFWANDDVQQRWLEELPVRSLWGVGPATARKLASLGVVDIRQLRGLSEHVLSRHVGPAMAQALVGYARGEDPRPVVSSRESKSVGHDETFAESLVGVEPLVRAVRKQSAVVARALRDSEQVSRTVTVVVRYDDMTMVSRSHTLSFGIDDDEALFSVARALVESIDVRAAVRLLGIHASSLSPRSWNAVQLAFAIDPSSDDARTSAQEESRSLQASREQLRDVIDEVRQRFGRLALGTGLDLSTSGLAVRVQRGSNAFGPDVNSADGVALDD